MADIFDRLLKNFGPLGQHRERAHGSSAQEDRSHHHGDRRADGEGGMGMTLILRRVGRGRWSPVVVAFDPKRQAEWPTPIEAKKGARMVLFGVTYRVSKVEA